MVMVVCATFEGSERGLSPSGVRSRKVRVLEDLETFAAEGLAVVEMHPDGRCWMARRSSGAYANPTPSPRVLKQCSPTIQRI